MRLCIFSDVHGNDVALAAGIRVMNSLHPDAYLFLGDLCGYYPNISYCYDMLTNLPDLIAIRGNHDEYFLRFNQGDAKSDLEYSQKYGGVPSDVSLDSKNTSKYLHWLDSLPFTKKINSVLMVHGSPADPVNGRIYSEDLIDKSQRREITDEIKYVVMGHTHYPLDVSVGGVRWINPGSTGQPRNGCPPSFYFLDCNTNNGYHVYFHFDREAFATQMNNIPGVTAYSKEVLWRY